MSEIKIKQPERFVGACAPMDAATTTAEVVAAAAAAK